MENSYSAPFLGCTFYYLKLETCCALQASIAKNAELTAWDVLLAYVPEQFVTLSDTYVGQELRDPAV